MSLPHWLKAPPARLGRRGACLTLLGIIWLCVGVSTALSDGPPDYVMLNGWGHVRGALWIATGAVAMLYAWKPQGRDWPGFVALYLMAGYRFVAYMFGFAQWLNSEHGEQGSAHGAIGAFTWLIIIVLIVTVAGWRESADDERRGQEATQ